MAFTYDSDLDTDRDKVRFHLRDIEEDAGPLPGDSNFSDAEIAALIDIESSWPAAVAAGFEALAASWRRYPSFSADGMRQDMSDIADGYEKLAERWRQRGDGAGAGSRAITRIDGFSVGKGAESPPLPLPQDHEVRLNNKHYW